MNTTRFLFLILSFNFFAFSLRAEETKRVQAIIQAARQVDGKTVSAGFAEYSDGRQRQFVPGPQKEMTFAVKVEGENKIVLRNKAEDVITFELIDDAHAKISATYAKDTFRNWTAPAVINDKNQIYYKFKSRTYTDVSAEAVKKRSDNPEIECRNLAAFSKVLIDESDYPTLQKIMDTGEQLISSFIFNEVGFNASTMVYLWKDQSPAQLTLIYLK